MPRRHLVDCSKEGVENLWYAAVEWPELLQAREALLRVCHNSIPVIDANGLTILLALPEVFGSAA